MEPLAWLHAERETLMTAVALAEPATAAELAHHLSPFLVVSGFADEAVAMLTALPRQPSVHRQRTRLLLADIALEHRRVHEPRPILEQILATSCDPHTGLYATTGLAICALLEGERDEAIVLCRRGLLATAERRHGDYAVRFHRSLGICLYEMGHVEEAIGHYEESIALSREIGWGPGVQITMRRLGEAYGDLGRFAEATAMLEHCQDLFERTGDTHGQALTAYTLGNLSLAQNRVEDALAFFVRCGVARRRGSACQSATADLGSGLPAQAEVRSA